MNKKIVAIDVAKSELVIYFNGTYSIIANENTVIKKFLTKFNNKEFIYSLLRQLEDMKKDLLNVLKKCLSPIA